MADLDLKILNRYIVHRNRAQAGGTDEGSAREAANARAAASALEEEYPGISVKADAVLKILATPAPPDLGVRPRRRQEREPEAPSGWNAFLGKLGEAVGGRVLKEVDEAGMRASSLERGQVAIERHGCAEGQVCVEVRMRVEDVLTRKKGADGRTKLDRALDQVRQELIDVAEDE